MNRWRNAGLAAAVFAAAALFVHAESDAVFQVEFSNPQLIPAQWKLEIHPDGTGHFTSVRGGAARIESEEIEPPNIDRDVRVSEQFAAHAFKVVEHKEMFRGGCDSHMKVAFQGMKKLTYSGPDGQGSCEFNYSRDPEIQALGDAMVSVATTLIEGARLQMLLLHDRLGLDKETEVLMESANDGRALEMGSIRDILERLAEDPAVLDRVKRRARILLAKAND